MMIEMMFKLRGELTPRVRLVLGLCGLLFMLLIWVGLTAGEMPVINGGILPKPWSVLMAAGELVRENELIRNTCYSLGLNLAGYVEAVLIAIPIGFLIGLWPLFRGGFQRQVDAFRFVPLTAVTGLFIIWFGLGSTMKIHFLAFGILIYLLPVIVQRIDEVSDVYTTTVYTLGASDWQTIRTVFWPSVISRLSDDIRVLTAISWTYIIIAESIGNEGGIGGLIWRAGQRQGRVDKVFALLFVIILVGVIQDKLFARFDKALFPYKYPQTDPAREKKPSTLRQIWDYAFQLFVWIAIGIYLLLLVNEFAPFLNAKVLSYLFADTAWLIHLLVLLVAAFKVKGLVEGFSGPKVAKGAG